MTRTAPAGALRDDVCELLDVVTAVLADRQVWESVRDRAVGASAADADLTAALTSIGLFEAAMLPPYDGGLSVVEAAAVLHASGEYLSPVGLADSFAAGPAVSAAAPAIAADIATGAVTLSLGVATADDDAGICFTAAAVPDLVAVASEGTLAIHRTAATEITEAEAIDPARLPFVLNQNDGAAPEVFSVAGQTLAAIVPTRDVLLAAEAVGAAATACAMTVTYVGDRQQFGRPIGSFQAVKHQLADVWCDIEVARAAVQQAAIRLDVDPAHPTVPRDVAVACTCSTTALLHAAELAIHLHGGLGIAKESGMVGFLRRALVTKRLLDPDRDREATVLASLRCPA